MDKDDDFLDSFENNLSNQSNDIIKNTNNWQEVDEKTLQRQIELNQYFSRNPTSLIQLNSLTSNNQTIRPSILRQYVHSTISNAKSFDELYNGLDILNTKLIQHGLVTSIIPNIDTPDGFKLPSAGTSTISTYFPTLPQSFSNMGSNQSSIVDLNVNLNITPIKKFLAKTGTNIGNSEGDGYLQFQLRNIFGGGEQLNFNFSKGTKIHSSYNLNYFQPITPDWLFKASLFKNSVQVGAPIDLLSQGIRLSASSNFLSNTKTLVNHEFSTDHYLRTTKIRMNSVSDTLLFQAGNDFISKLGYSCTFDSRDHPIVSSRGTLIKLGNEFAPDRFFKTNLEIVKNKSFFRDDFITMACTFKTGYIHNFFPNSKAIHRNDKFQNGGANDIRGFQFMGLGPKDRFDSVGGDAFISYGFSVMNKIPIWKFYDSNFRFHWFVNGGKLINSNGKGLLNTFNDLSKQNSMSVGMGIVFRHPMARFELNFAIPVVTHSGDITRKGFQYGIGLSFL
ncbi:hypothetical protein TBLA_0B06060 [Henningerozyma blattae CBS 6284]|uniref:Bacterial surface antigen (D15) domain-containing protein n=1 Tax=Henningerozyma blattae (strain ATCC 34711 / CBS 6284 / DSM 70876 / NBRC 10599 / NRRL Y-10934 / UCD 77-7) TaxID=1071380 RepID=I2GZ80_HENB6|nr:hypothetical protein TBLA_0B06060 [Tetrapisispora blattae CBS 6284]CCH59432.1 hypothetical protein TBLA_0B06060 [Tetrapisispora blattae CBS 6284]